MLTFDPNNQQLRDAIIQFEKNHGGKFLPASVEENLNLLHAAHVARYGASATFTAANLEALAKELRSVLKYEKEPPKEKKLPVKLVEQSSGFESHSQRFERERVEAEERARKQKEYEAATARVDTPEFQALNAQAKAKFDWHMAHSTVCQTYDGRINRGKQLGRQQELEALKVYMPTPDKNGNKVVLYHAGNGTLAKIEARIKQWEKDDSH